MAEINSSALAVLNLAEGVEQIMEPLRDKQADFEEAIESGSKRISQLQAEIGTYVDNAQDNLQDAQHDYGCLAANEEADPNEVSVALERIRRCEEKLERVLQGQKKAEYEASALSDWAQSQSEELHEELLNIHSCIQGSVETLRKAAMLLQRSQDAL